MTPNAFRAPPGDAGDHHGGKTWTIRVQKGIHFADDPAGPEHIALARRMSAISQAYMPMILHTYGVGNVLYYPWLTGRWPSQFGFSWKYVDIDAAKRATAAK